MQIPHCVHSEIPQKSVVRCPAPTTGRSVEAVGDATGESNRRGASDAGPCAYAGVDSVQVFGVAGSRVPEGKEHDTIHIARTFMGKPRNFTGESFWARGYFVSAVGRDEKQIR